MHQSTLAFPTHRDPNMFFDINIINIELLILKQICFIFQQISQENIYYQRSKTSEKINIWVLNQTKSYVPLYAFTSLTINMCM